MSISSPRRSPRPPLSGAERQARLRERRGPPLKAYIDPELRREIEHWSRLQQQSLADVVRAALAWYVEAKVRPALKAGRPRSGER